MTALRRRLESLGVSLAEPATKTLKLLTDFFLLQRQLSNLCRYRDEDFGLRRPTCYARNHLKNCAKKKSNCWRNIPNFHLRVSNQNMCMCILD